jgi:hypothetical protein
LQPALLFAAFADHVTMSGGILIHAMLFCFGLRIFFHAMHFRIRNQASNRNRMTDVIVELVAVALELPSAALRRGKSVLVGVVAFLQKPASVRVLLWVVLVVLRRCQAGCTGKQEQRKRCHRDHHFHVLPRLDLRSGRAYQPSADWLNFSRNPQNRSTYPADTD